MDRSRFERLAREYPIELVRVPFELRPDMAAEGGSASRDGLGHPPKVEEHMLRIAEAEGLPMTLPDHVPKTHFALTMGEVARDEGPEVHSRVHAAIFGAYFGEGRDIGCEDVLLDIAQRVGLDTEAVAEAWLTDRHELRLRGFRNLARQLNVHGTPAALVCNELMIGARPYEVVRQAVERCLVH